jgi:hypothetical protein
MTRRTAEAYAKGRWGQAAVVRQTRYSAKELAGMSERERRLAVAMAFCVGYRDEYIGAFNVVGFGDSWDAAVKRAERRPHD